MEVRVFKCLSPRFARVIIAGDWRGELERCNEVLRTAYSTLVEEGVEYLDFVTLCGGFVVSKWPEHVNPRNVDRFDPPEDFIEDVFNAAGEVAGALELDAFRDVARYVTFGVDFMYRFARGCDPGRIYEGLHMELVCVYDTYHDGFYWTGRSYPTDKQKRELICVPVDTHFMVLEVGGIESPVLVLGCHDLHVFNPRAWAKAKGYKKEVQDGIIEWCKANKPVALLHHPHMTDSYATWHMAIVGMKKLSVWTGLELFVSAGRYAGVCGQEPRMPLYLLLPLMRKGPSIDIVVWP